MPSVAGAGRHDSDHDMYVDKVLIIVAATIGASLLLAAISLAVTWYMRRRNRARMVELEDEEPIELQGLPPRPLESREDVYQSDNPGFSTLHLPRPRTFNERTMALASNPPSQTDLSTARSVNDPDAVVPASPLSRNRRSTIAEKLVRAHHIRLAAEALDPGRKEDEEAEACQTASGAERSGFYDSDQADPSDPRYDVVGAVRKFGRASSRLARSVSKRGSSSQQTSNEGPYSSLNREYTDPALVPAPLNPVRKHSSVRVPSSSGTMASLQASRPASVATGPRSSDTSMVIRNWPPPAQKNDIESVRWSAAPPPDVLEQARKEHEEMQAYHAARIVVMANANKAGEKISEDEVKRRAKREVEQSSAYQLQPTQYGSPSSKKQSSSDGTSATSPAGIRRTGSLPVRVRPFQPSVDSETPFPRRRSGAQ